MEVLAGNVLAKDLLKLACQLQKIGLSNGSALWAKTLWSTY